MTTTEPLHIFGVTLIGVTVANAIKLGVTVAWIAGVTVLGRALRWAALKVAHKRAAFWARQTISIVGALVLVAGVFSVWFNDPKQLATVIGLVTAGVAFALQRVITAVAGYVVILRGTTFNVGDRIVMGGVRGDVVSLNFMQTTIMEMGQTVAEQGDKPSMWVHSRQYTGRIVTITNAKVFDEPVYNYSKGMPYFWEEMRLPVPYDTDIERAERILLAAAARQTQDFQALSQADRDALARRYELPDLKAAPRVYYQLTDNWVELTVRFFTSDHGVRERKDAMSREILREMTAAGLQVASATYAIVQVPKLTVELAGAKP
jgi:small-conductance mechanosensitive channel